MNPASSKFARAARWSALAGFVAWTALGVATHLRWTTMGMEWGLQLEIVGFFLIAVLVTTPQCLALVATEGGAAGRAWRLAVALQPPAAASAFASFFLAPGAFAAALVAPWALMSAAAAACGVLRFAGRAEGRVEEAFADAGLVFLPVGAAWLAASRAGMTPLGFQEPIVLLTAVHFHFAGLVAPVVAAATGRRLRSWGRPLWPLFVALGGAIVLGVPLLAAGIALSRQTRHVELAGALLLAFGVGGLAVFTLVTVLPRLRRPGPILLLALSCASALASMHYAGRYAMSHWRGADAISIPRMVNLHGILNALGFAVLGLWAWDILLRPPPEPSSAKNV